MSKLADLGLKIVGTSSVVIRLKAVLERTGLSRATIYRLMKVGEFPSSFKIGKVASGWLEAEVSAWIDERASARQSADLCEYAVAA